MADFTWKPRGGLIERYIDVFGPTTDAPRQFHVFVCFTVMASVVGPQASKSSFSSAHSRNRGAVRIAGVLDA